MKKLIHKRLGLRAWDAFDKTKLSVIPSAAERSLHLGWDDNKFDIFQMIFFLFVVLFATGCSTTSMLDNRDPKFSPESEYPSYFSNNIIDELPAQALPKLTPPLHSSYIHWLDYLKKRAKNTVPAWVKNISPYRKKVEEILVSHGVPKEFVALSLIESGFNLNARSSRGAVGPWQFRKDTGRENGLKITDNVDERKDPYKSTHAAARFLKELYGVFEDWNLVLAAYNAGPYKVLKVIKHTKQNDFWALQKTSHFRKATKDFVPKFFAVVKLVREYDATYENVCGKNPTRECLMQYAKSNPKPPPENAR